MSSDTAYATNPLLFGHPRVHDVELSAAAVEVAQYFLEPRTQEEALAAGFEPDDLDMARKTGLVIPTDSSSYQAARLWEDRGWSRAAYLMQSELDGERDREEGSQPVRWRPAALRQIALPAVDITRRVSLDALVRRRSQRTFADEPLSLDDFSEVLVRCGDTPAWLQLFLAVQDVAGLARGVYRYEPADHRLDLVRAGFDDTEALAAVNVQPWVNGSGACAFLVVQWELAYTNSAGSRAYVDLLVDIGEIAQRMLHAVYHVGAGAWGTPALHETASRALLGIDEPGIDALYVVKFGPVPRYERAP